MILPKDRRGEAGDEGGMEYVKSIIQPFNQSVGRSVNVCLFQLSPILLTSTRVCCQRGIPRYFLPAARWLVATHGPACRQTCWCDRVSPVECLSLRD